MYLSLLLATAFFFAPGDGSGVKPVELTGIARDDWTNHAETASVCAVERLPDANILEGWKRLGVKMLKRVGYDPDDSASYFRRRVGFLALHEGADGVWLPDRDKLPEPFRRALEEAKVDVDIALYLRELAKKALAAKDTNQKLWIEGRRVNWFFEFMDFEGEDVDTLRLEFICYAKRLEQLLQVAPRGLTIAAPKPIVPDRTPSVPFQGKDVVTVNLSPDGKQKSAELAEGVRMSADFGGWGITLRGKCPEGRQEYPGGFATVRFYIPAPGGGYNPYEVRLDLGNLPAAERAPDGASGWFARERWLRGPRRLYADPENWRCRPIWHDAHSSRYPQAKPRCHTTFTKDGGWEVSLRYSWLDFYGFWPTLKNNIIDRWFVSVEGVKGRPDVFCRVNWSKGREKNFAAFGNRIDYQALTELYGAQQDHTGGIYNLWYDERLYGFLVTEQPTFYRTDAESDKVFWKRVVEPLVQDNAHAAEMTYENNLAHVSAKIRKADEPRKISLWKSLGKMIFMGSRVSRLRRDYILQRYAGGMPPEPPPRKPPEGAAALTAPDVDNDDDAIQLDEEVF